jgi:hypothetical protein
MGLFATRKRLSRGSSCTAEEVSPVMSTAFNEILADCRIVSYGRSRRLVTASNVIGRGPST